MVSQSIFASAARVRFPVCVREEIVRFPQNDPSARLEPGTLRSSAGALTSALASNSGMAPATPK